MAQVLGMVRFVWRGVEHEAENGGTYKPAGMMNTAVNAGRRTHHAQQYMNGEASCVVPLKRGDRLAETLFDGAGELQVHCDTGQIFTHQDAFLTEKPTVTAGEGGKITLTWNFGEGEEIVA